MQTSRMLGFIEGNYNGNGNIVCMSRLTDLNKDVDSPSEDLPSISRKHFATSENFFLRTGVGTLENTIQ